MKFESNSEKFFSNYEILKYIIFKYIENLIVDVFIIYYIYTYQLITKRVKNNI